VSKAAGEQDQALALHLQDQSVAKARRRSTLCSETEVHATSSASVHALGEFLMARTLSQHCTASQKAQTRTLCAVMFEWTS